MDSKNKSKNDYCSNIQEKIFELTEDGISIDPNSSLSQHISSCRNCQNDLKNMTLLKNSMQIAPSKNLYPDSRILKNIITFKTIKSGIQKQKHGSVWRIIRGTFEFRIPVYQALVGVAGALLLFMYISGDNISTESGMKFIEYAGNQKVMMSSELYVLDSLHNLNPERGQSAKEDSVLISFIVPTM